jgi:hypothetical protein
MALRRPPKVPPIDTEEAAWQTFRHQDFTGGENRKLFPEFIKPNQVALAQNCALTAENVLETRAGRVKVNTNSLGEGPVISAKRFAKEAGTKYVVAQHGTSLYAAAWDGATPFASFGVAVKTALSGAKLRYEVWKDNLICYSPGDDAFRFDGTTCTALGGTPPRFRALKVYAGRMWGVDAANPNFVRFSGLETYDTWDALDIIKVRDGDGDLIMGLSPQPGGLVIAKNNSLFPLYGTNRNNLRLGEPVSRSGCVSLDGMLDVGVLVSSDNWYQFDLSGTSPVPETHTPLLANLTPAQRAQAFGAWLGFDRRALFHLPSNEVVVMDAKRNAITTWRGLNAASFDVANAAGDNGELLVGDASEGHVYMLNGTDDDGDSIETVIRLAYNDMGTGSDKEWRYFWPKIEFMDGITNYEIFTRYDIDFTRVKGLKAFAGNLQDYLDWGSDDWGLPMWGNGANQIEPPYWLHNVRGEYVAFELRTNVRIRLKGYEVKHRITGVKS